MVDYLKVPRGSEKNEVPKSFETARNFAKGFVSKQRVRLCQRARMPGPAQAETASNLLPLGVANDVACTPADCMVPASVPQSVVLGPFLFCFFS